MTTPDPRTDVATPEGRAALRAMVDEGRHYLPYRRSNDMVRSYPALLSALTAALEWGEAMEREGSKLATREDWYNGDSDSAAQARATDAEIATLTARVADWERWHNRLGEIVGVPGGGVTLEAIATLTAERDRYRTGAETYNQQAADTIRTLTAENARVLGQRDALVALVEEAIEWTGANRPLAKLIRGALAAILKPSEATPTPTVAEVAEPPVLDLMATLKASLGQKGEKISEAKNPNEGGK